MNETRVVEGGITAPSGFMAAGIHAGLKKSRPDIALILSEKPAAAAGVFTTNKVCAACVKHTAAKVRSGVAQAVVTNSGIANACTGEKGLKDAERTADMTARLLGIPPENVLVCSTGVIGKPLPMDKIERGISLAVKALDGSGGGDAARAIMTTDTVEKQHAVRINAGGTAVTIGGMAKGAGMIEPNMATMLAFLTTDAAVDAGSLRACLKEAADRSFNRISIDGSQSTNDTVLFLANGAAGGQTLSESHPDWAAFRDAVAGVCLALALKIVADGEGATKLVTVSVGGAASDDDALKAAKAVANSLLVKTSWRGADPNWGRVLDAVGYSGAEVREDSLCLSYDGVCAVRNGMACEGVGKDHLRAVLLNPEFSVNIEMGIGDGKAVVYTCDCTEEYVRINSEYET